MAREIEEKWHFLAAIVLIFFISIITYRYYENPLRASKILRSKPVTVLIIFCSLILFSWWGIQKLYQNKPTLSFSSTFPAALWRGDNQSDNKYPIQCNLKTENLGLGKAQKTIFISSCSPEQRHGQENFTVFVAGDSHATAYMAALRGYAGASGNTVVIYSLPGCPFIDLIRSKAKIGAECLDIGTQIWNDIASQAQSKDVLFLPSLRLQRMVDQWPLTREILERSQITKRDRQEALDLAISYLETSQALNLRVVIEAPKPIFRTPTFRCADSWTKINPICKNGNFIDREEILAIRQPVMDSIHVLQSKFANISVWDPLPIICPEGHTQCGLWRDDKPLYFDADHLSGYGNTVIFESLRKAMDGSER